MLVSLVSLIVLIYFVNGVRRQAIVECSVDDSLIYLFAEDGKSFHQIGGKYVGWTQRHKIVLNNVKPSSKLRVVATNHGSGNNPAGLVCRVNYKGNDFYTKVNDPQWKIVGASSGGNTIVNAGYNRWGNPIPGGRFIWNNPNVNVPPGDVIFEFSFKVPDVVVSCAVDDAVSYSFAEDGINFKGVGAKSYGGWTTLHTITLNEVRSVSKLRITAVNGGGPAGIVCKIGYRGNTYYTRGNDDNFKIISSTSGNGRTISEVYNGAWGNPIPGGKFIWNSPNGGRGVPSGNIVLEFSFNRRLATVMCSVDDSLVYQYAQNGQTFKQIGGRYGGWSKRHTIKLTDVTLRSKLRIIATNGGGPAGLVCQINYRGNTYFTNQENSQFKVISSTSGTSKQIFNVYNGAWGNPIPGGKFIWNDGRASSGVPAGNVVFEFSFKIPDATIACAVDDSLIYQFAQDGKTFKQIGGRYSGWSKGHTLGLNNIKYRKSKIRVIAHNSGGPASLNCRVQYRGKTIFTNAGSGQWKIISSTSGTSKRIYEVHHGAWGNPIPGSKFIWNSPAGSSGVPAGNVVFEFSFKEPSGVISCSVDDSLIYQYALNGINYKQIGGRYNGWSTKHTITLDKARKRSKLRVIATNGGGPAGLVCSVNHKGHKYYTNSKDNRFNIISSTSGTSKTIYEVYNGAWGNPIPSGKFIWNSPNGGRGVPTGNINLEISFGVEDAVVLCAVDDSLHYQFAENGVNFKQIGGKFNGWGKAHRISLSNVKPRSKLRIVAYNGGGPAGIQCKVIYRGNIYYTKANNPHWRIISSTSGSSRTIYESYNGVWGNAIPGAKYIWNSPAGRSGVPAGNIVLEFSFTVTKPAVYNIINQEVSIGSAGNVCKSKGLSLPVFKTGNDYDKFVKFVKNNNIEGYIAIGLKYYQGDRCDPKSFRWVDGTAVTEENEPFVEDQPDGCYNEEGNEENCVMYNSESGEAAGIHDVECNTPGETVAAVICQNTNTPNAKVINNNIIENNENNEVNIREEDIQLNNDINNNENGLNAKVINNNIIDNNNENNDININEEEIELNNDNNNYNANIMNNINDQSSSSMNLINKSFEKGTLFGGLSAFILFILIVGIISSVFYCQKKKR